jgi:low affinity Fe/Cu permease
VIQGLAFLAALLVIALWLVSEPYFHYSDTWQLFINTTPCRHFAVGSGTPAPFI